MILVVGKRYMKVKMVTQRIRYRIRCCFPNCNVFIDKKPYVSKNRCSKHKIKKKIKSKEELK